MMRNSKKKGTMKRWIYWFTFLLVAEAGTFGYYNHFIGKGYQINFMNQQGKINAIITDYQKNANLISISEDGSRIAYVTKENELIVKNTSNNQVIYFFKDPSHPFNYIKWDGNSALIVGNRIDNTNFSSFKISTFNISSRKITTDKTLNGFQKDETVEDISFSQYTNDVYILIGDAQNTNLFHINTMTEMQNLNLNLDKITDIKVTQTTNELFLQQNINNQNNIYIYHQNALQEISNARMLTVNQDTLYYLQNNELKTYENGKVSVVNKDIQDTNGKIMVNENGDLMIMNRGELIDKTTQESVLNISGDFITESNNKIIIITQNGKLMVK